MRTGAGLERVVAIPGTEAERDVVAPAPIPPAGSPEAVVRAFYRVLDGTEAEAATLCDLLSADLRDTFANVPLFGCLGTVAMIVTFAGDGSGVSHRATEVGAVRTVRAGGLTIVRARLTHRFGPLDDPPRVSAVATIPVVREPGGWRIALLDAATPAAALEGEADVSVPELRAALSEAATSGRAGRAAAARKAAAIRPVGAAPAPCPGPLSTVGDPARDVRVDDDGAPLALFQEEPHVDVLAASHGRAGGPCFSFALRAPLRERFTIRLRAAVGEDVEEEVTVEVDGAAARGYVFDQNAEEEPETPVPVRVDVAPDRMSLTVRPAGPKLWPRIPGRAAYRWTAWIAEPWAPIGLDYVDRVPEARDGAPAPTSG